MANKVTIIIDADGKAYIEGVDKASDATNKFGNSLNKVLKLGAVAATAAVAGLTYALVKAVQAANAQEEATAKLEATLRSTAGAAGLTMAELKALAVEMQRTTIFGDEAVESAESLMLTFTKIGRETFPDAIRLAADMSVGMGQDLKSSVIQLGKALNDPIQGVSALGRVGVQLSDTQKNQIEQFMRLNDVASAQKVILGELATQFGGQAAAQANTFGGRLMQLKNAFGDLQEEIGFIFTQNTFFVDAIKLATEYLASLAQKINENRQYLMELAKSGIVSVIEGIGKAVEVMRFFHNGWLGIKLVGNAAAVVLADSLRIIFEGLRLVLKPLDLIFQGLVKLGAIESNPFDQMKDAISRFQLSSRDVTAEVLKDIEATNAAYDAAGKKISEFSSTLKNLSVEQAKQAEASSTGGKAGAAQDAARATIEQRMKLLEAEQKFRQAGSAAGIEEIKRASSIELQEIERLYNRKDIQADEYYNRKLLLENRARQAMLNAIQEEIAAEVTLFKAKEEALASQPKEVREAAEIEHATKLIELAQKHNAIKDEGDKAEVEAVLALIEADRQRAAERFQAEMEYYQLLNESPYLNNLQNYEGDNEVAQDYIKYQKKLETLAVYNDNVLNAMAHRGASEAEMLARQSQLEEEYAKKKRDFQISYAADAAGSMSNLMQNLYTATGSKNKAMFEAMKMFAIAETVISTYQGAQKAYTAMAEIPIIGPALGAAAAAAAIAAGMARVQAIKSQQPGGSASISAGGVATPSYGGGSPDAYPSIQRVEPVKAERGIELKVNIYGDVHSDDVDKLARKLVAPIQKALKDGVH